MDVFRFDSARRVGEYIFQKLLGGYGDGLSHT